MVYHLGFKAWSVPNDMLNGLMGAGAGLRPWWSVSWFGWIGVQVFFVISGFVIAWSSEGTTASGFLRSRVARLAPGMWVAATVGALVLLAWGMGWGEVFGLWIRSVGFYPLGPWIGGQFWTLPIEICFYGVVFALLAGGGFKHLELVGAEIGLISAGYWAVTSFTGLDDHFGAYTRFLLLQHGCYFGLGIVIWAASRGGWTVGRVLLGLAFTGAAWLQIAAACANEGLGHGLGTRPLAPFLVWLVLTGLLVGSVAFNGRIRGWLAGREPAVRLLGLATYPLYLLHFHVGGGVMLLAAGFGAPAGWAVVLGVAASLAAAVVVAAWIEPPLRRALLAGLDAFGKRRPAAILTG